MASEKQIAANRPNAQKSTGTLTPPFVTIKELLREIRNWHYTTCEPRRVIWWLGCVYTIAMSRQVHDFLSGFGSVLALSPEHDEPNFCYHGKDLTEIQVEDALRGDWEIVGKGLFDAIGQIDDDERCAERLNQIGR